MPLGNPIRKQNESRIVSVLATEGQTVFTVQGGYIINHISVFRNGVRLSNSEDFTAGDGSTVTLNNAANIEDRIEFHVFDRFTVQNAIVSAASTQTISGDLVVNGKVFGNLDVPNINTGILTATTGTFSGAIDANGGATIDNVTIGVDTDNEISTSTGDLNLDSSSGQTNVDDRLLVTGISTFTGLVDANGGAQIDNIRIGVANNNEIDTSSGDLTLDSQGGNVIIDDILTVTGISTFNGIVKCVSNLDVNGTTDFGAQVIISSGNLQLNSGSIVMATAGNITLGDSGSASDDRIVFGAGSDLSIYHNGTDSFIDNSTGGLKILGDEISLKGKSADEVMLKTVVNDTTELYFNNVLRMKTYAGGIDVFSNINAAGISSCSGNSNVGGEPPWAQASSYGRSLSISGSGADGTGHLKLGNGTATTNADFDLARISYYNGATEVARITGETGDSNNDSGQIMFDTKESGGSLTERLILSREGYLIPSTDSTYDLGTSSTRFRNIYADTLYGDGSNLTGISGVSVANQSDNRLITATGTTDALNGEANLTFANSGSDPILTITNSGNPQLRLRTTGTTDNCTIDFGDGDAVNRGRIVYANNGDNMLFYTNGTSGGEKIKLYANGRVNISNQQSINSGEFVHIEAPSSVSSGETIVTIEGNATAGARLNLKNNDSGASGFNELLGSDAGGQSTSAIRMYNTDQSNNYGEMAFATRDQAGVAPENRMRISKDGNVTIYGNSGTGGNYGGGGANPALYIVTNSGRAVKIHNPTAGTSGIQLTNSFTQQGEDNGPHLFCSGGGMFSIQNATHMGDGNPTFEFYAKNGSGTNKLIQHLRAWGYSSHLSTNSLLNLNTAQDGNGSDYFARGSKNSTQPGGGNDVFWIYEDGDMYNVNGTFSQSSDQRLKENIVDATSQWADFKALKFRKFNFKASTGYQTHTQLGLIAQEVELVSPGLVKNRVDLQKTTDENGKVTETDTGEVTKGIKQSVLYMKGMKALQEAMARIETLEAKVAALEGS